MVTRLFGLVGVAFLGLMSVDAPPILRPHEFWKTVSRPCSLTNPVVAGSSVFIGTCNGTLVALDRVTGAAKWTFVEQQSSASPAFPVDPFVRDRVVLTAIAKQAEATSTLYAFDQDTGRRRWAIQADVWGNLTFVGGAVVFGTRKGDWLAVDMDSGGTKWRSVPAKAGGGWRGLSVATDGVTACVLAVDGAVYGLEGRTGETLWRYVPPAPITSRLFVYKDVLYFGTSARRLYGVRPRDGTILADLRLAMPVEGSYATARQGEKEFDYLLGVDRRVGRAGIFALSDEFDAVRWRRRLGLDFASAGVQVARDWVIVGSCRGDVIGFDIARGTEAWRTHVTGSIDHIVPADGTVYIAVREGVVYTLQLS